MATMIDEISWDKNWRPEMLSKNADERWWTEIEAWNGPKKWWREVKKRNGYRNDDNKRRIEVQKRRGHEKS